MAETKPKRRIVLAEDEPATRKLLACQLENAGYTVAACEDGEEALAAIRSDPPQIVIADWMMPRMDGLKLCRAVRQLCASGTLKNVYFIMLTANSEKDNIVAGLEGGADDYLTKPYHPQELVARVRAGQRTLDMQVELLRSRVEVQKVNMVLAALNRELEKLANTDALTELPNRRHVLKNMQSAWALARRHDRPLSCIMLDVDHFKKINDDYGHEGGDIVLKLVAGAVRRHTRSTDVCGRFGGEEFLVFCPETDARGAAVLADRLRSAVARRPILIDGRPVTTTVSAGVAQCRPSHADAEALIADADKMLYAAKQHGRNQVWFADLDGAAQVLVAEPAVEPSA